MNRRLALHIGFWLSFLLVRGYTAIAFSNSSFWHLPWADQLWKGFGGELILLPIKAGFTYFILYYLLPRFSARSDFRKLAIISFAVLLATLLSYRLLMEEVVYPWVYEIEYKSKGWSTLLPRLLYSFFDLATIAGIATVIKLVRLRLESVEREKQLMEEKLQSELRFLKAQTNPHFLFNTLNNIYALARRGSEQTAEVVMKLSKLLRFMLYDCAAPRIPLSDELHMIRHYIELEKLRYNDRLQVELVTMLDNEHQPIAPLLLLPLVENAFKHGASEARFDTSIAIDIQLDAQQLDCTISNTVETPATLSSESGIGLKNVKRQLELTYPKHQFSIDAGESKYSVHLQINFSENGHA